MENNTRKEKPKSTWLRNFFIGAFVVLLISLMVATIGYTNTKNMITEARERTFNNCIKQYPVAMGDTTANTSPNGGVAIVKACNEAVTNMFK